MGLAPELVDHPAIQVVSYPGNGGSAREQVLQLTVDGHRPLHRALPAAERSDKQRRCGMVIQVGRGRVPTGRVRAEPDRDRVHPQ